VGSKEEPKKNNLFSNKANDHTKGGNMNRGLLGGYVSGKGGIPMGILLENRTGKHQNWGRIMMWHKKGGILL